jgi:tetratricopeptide (TPR) repeat protein
MRIRTLYLSFVTLAGSFLALGQDSLVKFEDLKFNSDFEKKTLRNYFNEPNQVDVVDLFLTTMEKKDPFNPVLVHNEINDCVAKLMSEIEGETEPKKVKAIYKYVHKRFFKVYKLKNCFGDIFEKGEYNCVSASALYSIIFQKLNIPFQIVEAPQHVFVVAYPNSHKIFIETTVPDKGYFVFNDTYIQKFVKYMYEGKIISKEEYESKSPGELFNIYYFKNNGLSLVELAGAQYCNYYAYLAEEEKLEEAFNEIKKAYCLSKSEKNRYLVENTAEYLVSNHEYKNEEDVNVLIVLCRLNAVNKKTISDEKIRYEFARLTEKQLIKNSDVKLYDASYKMISGAVSDTSLKKDIDFNYYYEKGRLAYNQSQNEKEVLECFEKAYKANPKHADLQNLIRAYIGLALNKNDDPGSISKMLDDYGKKFSFVFTDSRINSIRANCYLEQSYQSYSFGEISKGESFLNKFEYLMANNQEVKPGERFIEKAYSTAASVYFKKGNKLKTRETLKKGLAYAPDNFGLKIRLDQVK